MKRDLRKTEEEEKWRINANNRDRWTQMAKVAVLWSDHLAASPLHKGNQRKNKCLVQIIHVYTFLG